MSRQDIKNSISPAHSLAAAAHTADVDGDAVDLANFDAAAVEIHHGAWTDGTHTFEIQDADDDGSGSPDAATWAAVSDDDLDGTEPEVSDATADDTVTVIGYHGIKRHLRVTSDVAGATNGAIYGATVVRAKGRVQP